MNNIKRPAVAILIGMLIGIVYGLYLKLSIAVTIILLAFMLFLIQKNKKRAIYFFLKRRNIILIIFISILISSLYIKLINNKYEKTYKEIPKTITVNAKIVSEAKETEYYYSYEAKVENKKFIIYIKKQDSKNLKYGMLVNLSGEYIEPTECKNYKGFNYKEYLKTKKIYGSIKVENIQIIKNNDVNIILKISNDIRNKIIDVIKNILPEETQGLVSGILIGEKQDISEEITKSFSKSSLSHILAISGTHISYIIIGISFILNKARTPKKIMNAIAIISLIIFMFITRFSPSVVRACIMGIIMLFSKIVYRKLDVLNSMALSLIIILIDNPFAIKDIGLQLSYLGTLGIICLNIPITNLLSKHINRKMTQMLAVTISAQIIILPITIINFNNISTIFIISNILAVPITGAIILVGYANIVIGIISLKVGKIIAIFVNCLAQLLIWIAKITSKIPFANITVTTPNIMTVIMYYVLLYSIYKRKYTKCIIIIAIVILLITTFINVIPKNLTIHFVDVSQRRLYGN